MENMAVALDEQSRPLLQDLQPLWTNSAPRRVVRQSTADNPLGGWKAWQKHLAHRRNPEPPSFLDGKQPPLVWGWPQTWQRDELQTLLATKKRMRPIGIEIAAGKSLFGDAMGAPNLAAALQLLALAYSLPKLAKHASPERWWQLAARLNDLATEAQQHRVDWPADPADVVRQQLLAGELPLVLSYLFPEIRALRELQTAARSALSEGLLELTDGQGLPHGRLLPVVGPLFACWTRARWLGARLKKRAWSRKAEVQYEWLVRNALRLADRDGRFLLTHEQTTAPAWSKSLFTTAIALSGDECDCAAAAIAVSPKIVPKKLRYKVNDLPKASINSDWSGIAVLASGWSQSDVRLAVCYTDDPVRIELSARGERLLNGVWAAETTCDGETVQATGEWERLCWETGKRYSYLELSICLSHGLRLDRQLLLGTEDHVLYLTDLLVSTDGTARRLHHSLKLPVEAHITWQPEFETRDGTLVGSKARAAVMPLALQEWRSDQRGGSLAVDDGHLTLTQESNSRALCCPLFIDLDKKRAGKERTWRQLTVAEWMEVLPHDAAVSYRAQSGNDQWLFYRSLGPAGNRTFLGQNISGEFSAGRFHKSGKYKEWIEVEAV
jgi:hypothetical protein